MSNLKPCPFCGASAQYWSQGGRYGLFAWIECNECGARTKTVSTDAPVSDPAFFDEISATRLCAYWNRRDRA